MDDPSNQRQAIELLQQLGLKEYEAKSYVALSRLPQGTAKEISETSEVPRTRVYDAIRVLESKGLVEVQHSNPQQFRAVGVDEAVETLRTEYEDRAESLRETLSGLEPAAAGEETNVTYEVWALSGNRAISQRTNQLVEDADEELVMVLGDEGILTDELVDALRAADGRGVDVVVGTADEALRDRVAAELPGIRAFVSELEWLSKSPMPGDETEISRLLLADREAILASTFVEASSDGRKHERAVFGRGFDNGLVTIGRRLMVTGLLAGSDPAGGQA